jgi:hypothetical protein
VIDYLIVMYPSKHIGGIVVFPSFLYPLLLSFLGKPASLLALFTL